jgi:hypothetical protein
MKQMISENPVGKNEPIPDASQEPDQQSGHAKPRVPPVPASPELPPAHTHCQITCKTEKNWWDKFKPFVELVGIVLLAIYTGYTIKMYRANKQAADAATSAAATAKSTLDSSSQSFKQEERAYVAVTYAIMSNPPICKFVKGNRVCVDVHCANSGRTPAVGMRLHRYATFGGDSERTIKQMKIPTYAVPDGAMMGNVGDQWGTAPTDPVDATTAKKLINADIPVYIYGLIQYFDIFGEYHETGFCYERVIHSNAFIGCEFGNWFDKRPEYGK